MVEVMPRALKEKRSVGGMLITMKFVKTITRFGRTKVLTEIETFNNYHGRRGNFTYNPPYVPDKDSHTEDSLWHAMLCWEDCTNYPFANVTTPFLQQIIDDWFDTRTPEWYEANNLEPLPKTDAWKK